MNEQLVAFKRGCVLVHKSEQKLPEDHDTAIALISLIEELGRLGYRLSSDIIVSISNDEIKDIFDYVIPEIRRLTLDGHSITPLYPGFPAQTAGMSEEKRRMDQLRCYSGDIEGFLRDNPWEKPLGMPYIRTKNYLKLMSYQEFIEIPTRIMQVGNSITNEDKETLEWFLESYSDINIPERIPFKETLCIVLKYRPELARDINNIVRFGIYLLGGNPCLVSVPKMITINSWSKNKSKNPDHRNFVSLPRKSRRNILEMIENVILRKGFSECIKDSKRFYGPWLVLSERVHPGDYSKQYPEAHRFFETVKTRIKAKEFKTWHSVLQKMYDTGSDLLSITKYISQRPGEFVRRFDSLIRRNSGTNSADIMEIFIDCPGMKNKTLLSLYNYYDRRKLNRVIMIPGKRTPICLPPLQEMSSEVVKVTKYVIWNKILKNIQDNVKTKDLSGKIVDLDKKICNIPIPVGMRDNQTSIPTGTRFDIPQIEKTVRFFIHWVQEKNKKEDLDLSGYFFNSETLTEALISWNRSHSLSYAVYSGDVRNQPGDCAEFIDVDIETAIKKGWTHILMNVCNYYGRGFDTLECTLGYMLRGDSVSNSECNRDWFPIPSDIEHSIRPMTKTASILAFIVDLKSRQILMVDKDINGIPLISKSPEKRELVEFFSRKQEVTSYDVLKTWYEARGAKVLNDDIKEISEGDVIKVSFQDILDDYTKVLEAIGE